MATEQNSSTRTRNAVKRCCTAWQRAYDAYMAHRVDDPSNRHYAVNAAKEAYCNAMPLLLDYEGIRAFMACLSHGILTGAVPLDKTGPLSYAAQVALSSVQYAAKPVRPAPKNAPKTVQKTA